MKQGSSSPDKKVGLDPLMMAGTTSLATSLPMPISSPLTSPPITSPITSGLNSGHILKAALTNPAEVGGDIFILFIIFISIRLMVA